MAYRHVPSFRFEKLGLIARSKRVELWKGLSGGKPHLVQVFRDPRRSIIDEFTLQSSVHHSLFLTPSIGGFLPNGDFAFASPIDRKLELAAEVTGSETFVLQLLSFAVALQNRQLILHWQPGLLLTDGNTTFLGGARFVQAGSKEPIEERSSLFIHQVRACLGKADIRKSSLAAKLLYKHERRKGSSLSNCLVDLLQNYREEGKESLFTKFEWTRTKELEVAVGLFQLAERKKGKALVFTSEPGGGKSVLLSQIQRMLMSRDAIVTFYPAKKEERPYGSIREMLHLFLESAATWKKERQLGAKWIDFLNGANQIQEEKLVCRYLEAAEELHAKLNCIHVMLIDDLHNFDFDSRNVLLKIFNRCSSFPVLFLCASRDDLENEPTALTLKLEMPSLSDYDKSFIMPAWNAEQRRWMLGQVYEKTGGNPLLFEEYLKESIARKNVRWKDREWSFTNAEVPCFPSEASEFYLSQLPELSEKELALLQLASIHGSRFLLSDIESRPGEYATACETLLEKRIFEKVKSEFLFRKPMLAEAIYRKIDPVTLAQLHLQVADRLITRGDPEPSVLSRHYLRAGDITRALEYASIAMHQNKPLVLMASLYDELGSHIQKLTRPERAKYYRDRGELFFRKGNYTGAADNFQQALNGYEGTDRFRIQLRIAESHLMENEMFSASATLKEMDRLASGIQDKKLLMDFYFARAVCNWHRGQNDRDDFQSAFLIAEELQDYEALGKGYLQKAKLNLRGGEIMEARLAAKKSLHYFRRVANHEETANVLKLLASIAWRQSKYSSAEKIIRRAIRLYTKLENDYGLAYAWNLLGNISVERYSFRQAVDCFRKALDLFGRLDHPLELSLAQFNLGLVYVQQGNMKQAEAIFLRCLSSDKRAGNRLYYAYDLRALAVVAILRGFYRKADRLLQRVIEICTQLKAEGDILQTNLILLFSRLDQGNYREAPGPVEFLEAKLAELHEPMSQAEIHYLVGWYYCCVNQTEKGEKHLANALRLAHRIRFYSCTAKCLILRLIFRARPPRRDDPDLLRAARCFTKINNELETSDHFLRLYQAYPSLMHFKEHTARLKKMERIYRSIHHKAKHRMVRALLKKQVVRSAEVEPLYEWWKTLIEELQTEAELEVKVRKVLSRLSEEFHACWAALRFVNAQGVYEELSFPEQAGAPDALSEFRTEFFGRIIRSRQKLMIDLKQDTLGKETWRVVLDIRGAMGLPILKSEQLIGFWYFERAAADAPFSARDLEKISFFSAASVPAVESALTAAFVERFERTALKKHPFVDFIGTGQAMQHVFRQIIKLAPHDIAVLILGESGTGKELVARNLHRNSRRADGPFLALNCSAIPETLIESELFGFAKGAFTGAISSKLGLIERANGGTLFLDEIADLSPSAQAKLLRVMQEHEIQRLGETASRKVDVRFLFATHKDLSRLVKEEQYRHDLFYRINVYSLKLPALRERKEDIPLLVQHFIQKYSTSFARSAPAVSPSALKTLMECPWPGNVRELENVIQTILINSDSSQVIDTRDLPPQILGSRLAQSLSLMSLDDARQEFEREFLLQALKKYGWNKSQTARELKITRQGLINMIQRLGIQEK